MRRTCLDLVYELAKQDERVFFIGSDLGAGTLDQFKAEIPERFLMEGVAEANLIGVAAGMALDGKIPYVNTIGTFITRRCYEQVVLDLCLHHVNVRLIGNGGGVVYAPLGPTHLAFDDLAIFRAIPNMTIVAPCDADEMTRLMPQTLEHQGPLYIRLGKGGDPIVSSDDHEFRIGKAIEMRQGSDALIVTTGITLKIGLEAATELATHGIESSVLHVHTVKPLDSEAILERAADVRTIVVVEEHTVIGGLGSAVAELLAESDLMDGKRFRRVGFPDVFPEGYGSQASMMARYGITAEHVAALIQQLS